MIEPTFGWHKDTYDKRDWLHKMRVVRLPERVNLVELLTPVRDQGMVNSCVGFGLGMNYNSVKVKLGIYKEWCSPTYIYNGARYIEGTLDKDVGCYPRNALKWTKDCGILLERYWVYNPIMFDPRPPSSEHIEKADKYKGFAYYRCVDGIEGICDALASGHLVSIGNPWFREWMATDEYGMLSKPTAGSTVVGGHMTCLYGYNMKDGLFQGVNSWGTNWGVRGLFAMPFEAIDEFKRRGGYDAYYVVFTEEIDDTSPIPPEPSPCKWGNAVAKILNKVFLLQERGRAGRFYYLNPR